MKRKLVLIVILLILSAFTTSPALAAVYYVATTGSNTNPGTLDQPWLTVSKAASVMTAGDTTYVRGGTYHETGSVTPVASGNATDGYITFQNYQDETVTLDGTNAGSAPVFYLPGKSYIRVIGFRIVNYIFGISLDAGTGSIPGADHIEVRHCYIHVGDGSNGPGIIVRKGHDLIFADTEIYDCKNGLAIQGSGYGIFNEAYNVQALDIYSHDHWGSEGDGVQVSECAHDIFISGCEAFNTHDDCIDVRGYNITIENCIARDCTYASGHGFKCYGIDPCDGSVPDYHVRLIKCLSYNTKKGFYLSALGNNVQPSTRPSFRPKKMIVINCTSANDVAGVLMEHTYDNYPLDAYIHNTISGSNSQRALRIFQSDSVLTANYNLWWMYVPDLEPIDRAGTYYSSYLIENPSVPGSWFAATGNDANSRSVDPCFVDTDSNNFTLQPASVCIDAGTDMGLPYAGSAPDMGTFETGAIEVNCPANFLTTGENWISIPVAPENGEAYSVFKDLGYWPNCVYHNLYRYNSPMGSFTEYPTYQSDPVQFGQIIPGGAYKLMLGSDQPTIKVYGIALTGTQTFAIGGSGTRDFYFGAPFNRPLYKIRCKIKNGTTEVSIDEAISNGWIGNVQHFNPAAKSWEAIGNTLEAWHAYKLTAYTVGVLQLIIYDRPTSDLNRDGKVNYADLALFVEDWLVYDPISDPLGDLNGDDYVDLYDFAVFAQSWVNYPPMVNAGSDQTIINPVNTVNLNGTVTDDGLPNPPGQVTANWTVTSSPGPVLFDNANAADAVATLSAYGTYVFRLTAGDSELSAYDEVAIIYLETPPVNQAPVVNAGSDQTINLPAGANLSGTVTDDGLPNPPAKVIVAWTKTSGPGMVTFGNANAAVTTASFSAIGTYVLRLTANDSALQVYDEVTITVNPGSATFYSADAKDGYVIESTETSGVGGTVKTTATYIGDSTSKQQYIAVLHFNTSSIPDGAVILSATISVRRLGKGGDPTSLGTIAVDIKNGYYGASDDLVAADFEAPSSAISVTTLPYPAANGDWSSGILNSSGLANINKTGVTQFKIRFTTDDDNDATTDYLSIYDSSDPPKLEVTWQ